jgi:hypothetical protein
MLSLRQAALLFLLVFGALSYCCSASAQGGSASLGGLVTDPSGLAVSGAKVQAVNAATGLEYSTETNESGAYNLPQLPPGSYRILVSKDGFTNLAKPGVEIHAADVLALNFSLEVGSVSQTVTVEGGAPLVDTTTSSLGGLVTEQKIEDLPLNGRNYIDLALMQPGVSHMTNLPTGSSTAGTWFSSNGAPLRSNNYTLDGAILQTLNNGSTSTLAGTTLGLDGIEEFRVITNALSAEYGLGMGSQTVMVSRGGTNQFHGSAFEYLRNSVLDSANYFDVPTAANDFQRLPPFRRNNFGASFGGPIQKGKTFFYATYEGLRQALGVTTITNVFGAGCHGAAGAIITNVECPQLLATPSVTIVPVVAPLLALYPTPNLPKNEFTFPADQPSNEDYGQIRVDHTFSPADSMFGRYTADDSRYGLVLAYPQFTAPQLSRHQYATLGETHVFSSSLLNIFHLSFSRTATHRTSPTDLIGPDYSFVPGEPIAQIAIGGVTTFGPAPVAPAVQTQNIVTLSDDVSLTRGRQSIKFGTLISDYRQYGVNNNGVPGQITFGSVASFLEGVPTNYLASTPGSIVARTYHFYTTGFYIEDDWRLLSRLTLNLGLRYDPMTQINEVHGTSSALINPLVDSSYTVGPIYLNPSRHNFSPRVGFAWDVFGDGKTAVRGGFAILYDIANLGDAVFNLNPRTPPFSSESTVSAPTSFTVPLTFPAASLGKSGDTTFQYHMNQQYLITENLTLEHQFPFKIAASLSYAGSHGVHLINLSEGNPIPPEIVNGQPYWPADGVRINPNWGTIGYWNTNSSSSYNALEFAVTKRVSHGLEFQSSYTWSKLLDDAQGESTADTTTSSSYNTDPFNRRIDRGPAAFNIPQSWVFNTLYNFPSPKAPEGALGILRSGWSVSSIFTAHSGLPFTVVLQTERSRSGVDGGAAGIDRPDYNPAFTGPIILGLPTEYFNPNAFMLQPVGTLGDVPRDSLSGPGYADLDLSLRKDTRLSRLGEAGNFQFRADFFNALNRANFSEPNNTVFTGALADVTESPLSTAGVITSTIAPSREIQFSVRLSW